MSDYPSEEDIPPVIQERFAFAAWILLSLIVVGLYGGATLMLALPAADLLPLLGLGLCFGAFFGVLGFALRRRRRAMLVQRAIFLASLSQLDR